MNANTDATQPNTAFISGLSLAAVGLLAFLVAFIGSLAIPARDLG
jgi:hypothetical protein